MYGPLEGDLPRKELMESAERARLQYGVEHCDVIFKFTCMHCGERCALREENQLFEQGECYKCGKETPIEFGGFMLAIRMKFNRQKGEI